MLVTVGKNKIPLPGLAIVHFLVEAKFISGAEIFGRTKEGHETEIPFPEVPALPKSVYQRTNILQLEV